MKHLLAAADLYAAAGRTHMPVAIEEIRAMATKSIGRVSKAALAEGKIKPAKSTPKHFATAKKAKADRAEAGLRRNRARKATRA